MLRLGGVDVRAAWLRRRRFRRSPPTSSTSVADRQALAGAEDDVLPLERAETLERDPERVHAGLQVGDLEVALVVAGDDARVVGRLADHRHRRAGNDLPLGIGDRPGHRSGHRLRAEKTWQQKHEGDDDPKRSHKA